MFIVDAHLDLAYNALRGREVLRRAVEQTPDSEGTPSVGLPDLHAGKVGMICATIFCMPAIKEEAGYRTAEEARQAGLEQLRWYQQFERESVFRFVRNQRDLPDGSSAGSDPLPAILLLEGADPLRTPADVAEWVAAGMQIVGLAWRQTRYAGGTGAPGPLTPAGIELVTELDRHGVIHDLSHLAEEAFWQLLDRSNGPVMASHSNCRAFVPTDRQLSDDMIKAIVARGGVIGINFFDKFLLRPDVYKTRRALLSDVVEHMKRMCDLAGDATHVAIGTDMDGGLGREQIPQEIRTSEDLPRVGQALSAAGFDDNAVKGILGQNWLDFFRRALPS